MAQVMEKAEPEISYGFCQCGCGEKTRIAPQSMTSRGWVRGEPVRYVQGHHTGKSRDRYLVDADTGCWVWQRCKDAAGYGQQWDPMKERVLRAHVFYYEQNNGPVPEGLQLDHLCRNPSCVNPEHLEPVSPAENVRRGSATKLTASQVAEIRRSSLSPNRLAEKFGVSRRNIRNIREDANRWRAE